MMIDLVSEKSKNIFQKLLRMTAPFPVMRSKCSDLLKTMNEWRVNKKELKEIIEKYSLPEVFQTEKNENLLFKIFETKKKCN